MFQSIRLCFRNEEFQVNPVGCAGHLGGRLSICAGQWGQALWILTELLSFLRFSSKGALTMAEKLTSLRQKMQEYGYQAAIIGKVSLVILADHSAFLRLSFDFKSPMTSTRANTCPSMMPDEAGFRASRARRALPWLRQRKLPCGPTLDITLKPTLFLTRTTGS